MLRFNLRSLLEATPTACFLMSGMDKDLVIGSWMVDIKDKVLVLKTSRFEFRVIEKTGLTDLATDDISLCGKTGLLEVRSRSFLTAPLVFPGRFRMSLEWSPKCTITWVFFQESSVECLRGLRKSDVIEFDQDVDGFLVLPSGECHAPWQKVVKTHAGPLSQTWLDKWFWVIVGTSIGASVLMLASGVFLLVWLLRRRTKGTQIMDMDVPKLKTQPLKPTSALRR